MSLKDQLRASLGGLAPFGHGSALLAATEGDLQLRVELVALDKIACAFDQFTVSADALRGANSDRLKQVAERLSSSLTYLLEPISPIEIDAHGATVQMRSNPPQKEDGRTTYYELLVRNSGELSLRRYERQKGLDRTPIAAEVTREVLLRLASDFSSAV